MNIERRSHMRVFLQSNAYAALGRDYSRVGKIKNISRGGLAFEYISGEQDPRSSTQVDIFIPGKVFHLYDVPCNMVYDIDVHVPHVDNCFIKFLTTKCCGLQFKSLTEDEQKQLKFFIEGDVISHDNPKTY